MKRFLLEMSEFDLKYIRKILFQDYLYCRHILEKEFYDSEEEKLLLQFSSKHSKSLSDKILSFLEDSNNV